MELVRLDEKMRIRLPKRISNRLKLAKRATLALELKGDGILLTVPKDLENDSDPVLKDMLKRPMHSDTKVTRELLEKWEEEMYQ